MFDARSPTPSVVRGSVVPAAWPSQPHSGLDVMAVSNLFDPCMVALLDEVDYGLVLVNAQSQVLHLNHAAHAELYGQHPLQLHHGEVYAAAAADQALLADAVRMAEHGLRSQVRLGLGPDRVRVSVVPVAQPRNMPALSGYGAAWVVLLILGKRPQGPNLALQGYARSTGLTPAETRVLELLVAGQKPCAIAKQNGVAISTVRSQINVIRAKAQVDSIGALVREVASLPPLVGALRHHPAHHPAHQHGPGIQ